MNEQKNSKVGIVIVTYNSENDIKECIESIYKQNYKNFEIILVDNDSKDLTLEIVKSFKKDNIHILPQNKNKYLTKGNNIGIRFAVDKFNSEYILILNPDTVLEENVLSTLVETIEKSEKNCAVGPKLKFLNKRDFGLINSAGIFYDGYLQAYDIGFKQKDIEEFNKEREVFGVSGACILFRTKSILDVGLYWEKIKLYMDELELFIRLNKKGYKTIYQPKCTVWHKYMQSTNKIKLKKLRKIQNFTWLLIALRHYEVKKKIKVFLWYFISFIKLNLIKK